MLVPIQKLMAIQILMSPSDLNSFAQDLAGNLYGYVESGQSAHICGMLVPIQQLMAIQILMSPSDLNSVVQDLAGNLYGSVGSAHVARNFCKS